ncbi:sensor histidine kinase [Yinghuangia seranimata]|uniref:sensor histidine kinase n=1 Tax=Yinghuangia seranimata TaxID=408067 RepID=UPI00248D2E6D|nr:HAMP domain-containing sensor histidine kinase [Yinghuangia seranimata]MDI2125946.1 HAMP domain-containing sensor histidine kinase [Yinghuangia seranimata]
MTGQDGTPPDEFPGGTPPGTAPAEGAGRPLALHELPPPVPRPRTAPASPSPAGKPPVARRARISRRAVPYAVALGVWGAAVAVTGVFASDYRVYLRFAPVLAVAVLGPLVAAGFGVRLLFTRRVVEARAQVAAEAAAEHHRFLRRLDHELKNPLTAIRLGLANVSASGRLDAQGDGTVRSVEEQVARLTRITGDLRKLADVESRPLERLPVDVGVLLEDAGETARELPGGAERDVSVSVPRVPWPLPTVAGDPDLLELALENLVGNALKYSGPGSRIELRAFEEDGYVVVEVADTGHGIRADELPYVWGELVRGSDARGTPGSGLGLALVHAVVDRHGGRCEIRSRPESGTVVRLRLPSA